MSKEVILITGGSSGLGKGASKKLIDLGYTVIITGRSEEKLKEACEFILKDSPDKKHDLHSILLDLKDLKSVESAVKSIEALKLPAIDIIIHNAGGTCTELKLVNGEVEETLFMNAVAPLYLNRLLMPYIEKSTSPKKRIIFVTSGLHDPNYKGGSTAKNDLIPKSVVMDDLKCEGKVWSSMKYYRISKLNCVWNTFNLVKKYPSIKIFTFCPGFVPDTELSRSAGLFKRLLMKHVITKFSFTTSIEASTDNYVYYATSDDVVTGGYYVNKKKEPCSEDASNEEKQAMYWEFANRNIDALIK
ncbi:hypothetical protein BDB01DRAFT_722290 [Pilobolus umbonatus]|nr:hypothetical protein BDB01DRAFT_722290 [Pilobolus umbonatus]